MKTPLEEKIDKLKTTNKITDKEELELNMLNQLIQAINRLRWR